MTGEITDVAGLKDKLVRLTDEQANIMGMKKSANKDYNDQLKDIKLEIKDTMDLIKENDSTCCPDADVDVEPSAND